jgi:hypothetical protein
MSIFANLETDFENFWTNHMKPFLNDGVEPILKTFMQQFDSQFGQQAITDALAAVASLSTGAAFGPTAIALAATMFGQAKADAATNATLDAAQILQTIQSALQVAKAGNNITTPADQQAAQAIAATPAA